MATKQYEYFGNQNPTMNSRYNRGRVDAQRLANDKAVLGNINTPFGMGYQIGSAIGNAWADTYNERGVEKGRGEMQSALDNYLKQNGGTQQSNMPNAAVDQEALANDSAQINGGVLGGLAIQPMSPQDAYKEYKNQAWLSKYGDPNNPNPDSSAIQVKNDVQGMDKMGDGIDFGKINKEDVRQAMREQLRQNGRTPYQIDQVMSQFDSMYDAKEGKWRENKVTDLITKGQNAAKEGRWDDAQNYYMAAGQYDPKRAGMYMQGMQQSYARQLQAQQQRDKEYMAGYMRDENGNLVINSSHPIWTSRKYGGVGGSRASSARNSNSGNGAVDYTVPQEGVYGAKRSYSKDEYSAAKEYLNNEKNLDENGKPVNPRLYQRAQEIYNGYNSENFGAQGGYQTDENTQRQLARSVRQALHGDNTHKPISDDEAVKLIQQYGLMTTPYGRKFLEEQGLGYLLPVVSADDADNYSIAQ